MTGSAEVVGKSQEAAQGLGEDGGGCPQYLSSTLGPKWLGSQQISVSHQIVSF